ncbi:MAG: thiamine phosphate synthase [Parvibaculum sedimenti]|uniref:thiamine phosphate synthase n=1 Tax=Parvibaculum sedimenti TaxID=2608632 RepID=UPI003BB52FFA
MKSDPKLVPRPKPGKRKLPTLILMTDATRAPDPAEALACAPKGAAVIYRAYGLSPIYADLVRLGRMARRKGVRLLIAGNLQAVADGAHFPEYIIRQSTERRFAGRARPGFLVTAAAHSERAVIAAARAGADAVLISPVFATRSHPGAKPLGPVRFARLAVMAHVRGLAVYALGGMTTDDARRRLSGTCMTGIAGIGLAPKQKERA